MLLFSFSADVNGQVEKGDSLNSSQPEIVNEKGVFACLFQTQKNLWTSPTRLQAKDLAILAPIALTTGLLIHFDEDIYSHVNDFKNEIPGLKIQAHILPEPENPCLLQVCIHYFTWRA